jgi:hypothetical protein
MHVSKGRDADSLANIVHVVLVVVRVRAVAADILVTCNLPLAIAAGSQSSHARDHVASEEENVALVQQLLQSFTIVSLDIFGQP